MSTVDGIAAAGLVNLVRLEDEDSARAAVDDGDVGAAWVIPRGFSTAVQSGRETEIVVIGDVDATNTASFALAVAAVVAATGIMSVAGAAARTTEQAGNVQGVVAVVLGLLGGAFVPIPGSESGLLAQLQMLTPHGWFLDGLAELRSHGLGAAMPAVVVLLGMGAVTGAVGLRMARSMLRR